ncbi:PREDICTED: MOB kinase activator 1B [Charadrius vociferus]|uniref:MOB kinase activator 1B n=1 Tax=Charadrius vociferus TaxID=50402 RepID=UPI000521A6E4|nr:PREDICTED: MOB kinase activator 1B [Charadrius vociferus]
MARKLRVKDKEPAIYSLIESSFFKGKCAIPSCTAGKKSSDGLLVPSFMYGKGHILSLQTEKRRRSDVGKRRCLVQLENGLWRPNIFVDLTPSDLLKGKRGRVGSRSSKTFKPKKNIPEGSHQYELLKHAEATLGSGNLRMAVMLPEGEDLNEWVAVNTVDFFNQINMLYGTITDFCTEESCPVMSAGPKYEYHWADGTNIKKPIKCSAPKYIDYLMTWVQDQLDDETLFPSKIGVPFPKNFMSVAKTILKRLFRVYAHIYHQHFDPVIQLQEEAHLNTSFKHFIFFVQEFNLIDRRELAPLQELIEKLTSKDR